MRHSLDNSTPAINLAVAASAPAPLAIRIEDGRVASMKDSDGDLFERPDRQVYAAQAWPFCCCAFKATRVLTCQGLSTALLSLT